MLDLGRVKESLKDRPRARNAYVGVVVEDLLGLCDAATENGHGDNGVVKVYRKAVATAKPDKVVHVCVDDVCGLIEKAGL